MRLQKAPSGLLGAFKLKVDGANPSAFGDGIVPVVDVFDQYLADELTPYTTGPTAAGVGSNQFTQTFSPPAGKVWRLVAAGGYGIVGGADAAFVGAGIIILRSPSGPLTNPFLYAAPLPQLTTLARPFAQTFRAPIFVPPGWAVQTQVQWSANLTVGGFHTGTVLVQEFDA